MAIRSRALSAFVLILINAVVFVALLILIEVGFRLFADGRPAKPEHWQEFRPYIMFAASHNKTGSWVWRDIYRNTDILMTQHFNNTEGFATSEQISAITPRAKAANERVVLLSGGSALWGVGSSSGSTTIAGQLEQKLNGRQRAVRYKVINLAMGGWNSFQQFIALSMYGQNLQPDWLITMDGHNDAAVACAHQQGAGRPLYFAMMEAYIRAYTFGQHNPPVYRSRLENWLLERSEAYRKLTKEQPIHFDLRIFDSKQAGGPGEPAAKVAGYDVRWEELDKQLVLYRNAEQRIIDLFPDTPIILSLQPVTSTFSEAFGELYAFDPGTLEAREAAAALERQLHVVGQQHAEASCGAGIWPVAKNYFYGRAALALEQLARENRERGRSVQFINAGIVLPDAFEERQQYLIDMMHLNDAGAERVAELYARLVLARDFPAQFKQPALSGANADADLVKAKTRSIGWIRHGSLVASYGENCKDAKPAVGSNTYHPGNATSFVRNACASTAGICTFTVDVARLGDPVNGCGKDFNVRWVCAHTNEAKTAHAPGEAHQREVTIDCVQ